MRCDAHLQLASIRPTDRHELLVPRCERLIAGTFRTVGQNGGAKEKPLTSPRSLSNNASFRVRSVPGDTKLFRARILLFFETTACSTASVQAGKLFTSKIVDGELVYNHALTAPSQFISPSLVRTRVPFSRVEKGAIFEVSRLRGRAVQGASRNSKRSSGRFRFTNDSWLPGGRVASGQASDHWRWDESWVPQDQFTALRDD
jgi:hypothetical protein